MKYQRFVICIIQNRAIDITDQMVCDIDGPVLDYAPWPITLKK